MKILVAIFVLFLSGNVNFLIGEDDISSIPFIPTDPSVSRSAEGVPKSGPTQSDEDYSVSIGDKLEYRVLEDHEEIKHLKVSSSGEIIVPYIGRIAVVGKKLSEVRKEIRTLLERDLYYEASVILSVEEKNIQTKSQKIYVVGQVRTQGQQDFPVDEKYTVSRAILRAGGLASFANGKKVQVIRKSADGKEERKTVNVIAVLKDGKMEEDLELKPDDMVIVPEKLINL